MGTRLRTVFVGALVAGTSIAGWTLPAVAATSGREPVAQAGVLVAADLPSDFTSTAPDAADDAQAVKVAKGIAICKKYIALKKLSDAQPQAKSRNFEDSSRHVSNEVDVFKSTTAATSALALYGNSSVPKCIEALFTKLFTEQFAKQKSTKGKIASVKVTINQQPISGLGDASVVYEGNALVTGKDGSTAQIGIGNAAVQVGPAISDYTYTTSDAALNEILQPAIESSVARLQAAVASE